MHKKETAIKEHRNNSIETEILSKLHVFLKNHNIVLNKTDKQTLEAIVLHADKNTGIAHPTLKTLANELNISVQAVKYRIKKLFERIPEKVGEFPLIIKHKNFRYKSSGKYANNVYVFPFIVSFNHRKNPKAAEEFKQLSWEFVELSIREKKYIEQVKDFQEKFSNNWDEKIYTSTKNYKAAFIKIADKLQISYNDVAEIFVTTSNTLLKDGIADLEKYLTAALANKAKNARIKDIFTEFCAIALDLSNRTLDIEEKFIFYPIIKNIFDSVA